MSDTIHEETPMVLESRPAADDQPPLDARIEAAAFRQLLDHLRQRADVQNIDLMGVGGFCRNCLADWVEDAAADLGTPMTKNEARRYVYQMPYAEWKANQPDGSAEQVARMDASVAENRRVRGEPDVEKELDAELAATFPASDTPKLTRPDTGPMAG